MKRLLPFLLFVTVLNAQAQLNNDSLENRIRPDSSKAGELYLNLFNFNFLRNYEFFSKFQDGYTLFGTQLEPQIVYYAHPSLVVTAGASLRKDFGGDGIYKTYPLFSLKYHKRNTTYTFGSLEGNIHHKFIEPLYDFERKITDPLEYGAQVTVDKEKLFLDGFINWKRMIYKPSPVQEQISAGFSADISVYRSEKIKFSVPAQLTVFHQGGQIDIVPDDLKTLVNSAIGFKLQFPSNGFISNVKTENYVSFFTDASPNPGQAFENGHGVFLNGGIDSKLGTLIGSYWNGNGFISPTGMPVYQSVSQQIDNPGLTQKKRELVFLRYAFQKQLVPELYLDVRAEPLMDLNPANGNRKVEFYHSLFLVYKHSFRLLKKK